jgi:hypothetical protein
MVSRRGGRLRLPAVLGLMVVMVLLLFMVFVTLCFSALALGESCVMDCTAHQVICTAVG